MSDKQSDFIEQLFDAISNDPTMPAELKISVLRLQLPILKLSQSDPNFLSNDKHPARRTLFIAKRLASYAKTDPSLLKKIDIIVSELTKSSATLQNFSNTNQRLELLAQNLESKEEAASNKDLVNIDNIKTKLNHKIKLCIQGNQIPNKCKTLTLKLWPNALFYILKTHGEDSPQWINGIEMYCQLIEAIQPIPDIDKFRELKDNYLHIAKTNNNMLLLYHQESAVEPAIKSLINHFNYSLGNLNQNLNNNRRSMSILDKISSLPANVKPGAWCEIYIDDVTPSRRLRLSLINMEAGTLMFVNRKGIKKLEKDAYEFSQELSKGLSKIYTHDDIFKENIEKQKAKLKNIG